MVNEQFDRFIKVTNLIIRIAVFGLIYYLIIVYGVHIPCVFRTITGLKCPGCGISRMFLALLRGNLSEAWYFNCFVLTLLPFGVVYAIFKG